MNSIGPLYDAGYLEGRRSALVQIDCLEGEKAALVAALRALCDKLDEVTEATVGIFTIAALHHAPYTGPTYEQELKGARAVLSDGGEGCICGAPGPQPCGPDCNYPYTDRPGKGPFYTDAPERSKNHHL